MPPFRSSKIRSLRHGIPLTWRILAVNIFVIALLVGGFLYLDGYRTRLVEERERQLSDVVRMTDITLQTTDPALHPDVIRRFASLAAARIRQYDQNGALVLDSFALAPPTYALRDPNVQGIERQLARGMDSVLDWVVGTTPPERFVEPVIDTGQNWPEIRDTVARPGTIGSRFRFAPDRTPMLSIAMHSHGRTLLLLVNARDITRTVRAERFQLGLVLAAVSIVSILLSLFLARTIVRPLQRLAEAATRVRLGRDRDVVVPRLPERGDEIGTLARTLSDMTLAMRARIDAGEDFAADVTHELKNPLASLRSAIEGMGTVTQPALRKQLLAIANDDVRRLDRLITDISEASRVDAELSRTRFERIDVGLMISTIIAGRRARATSEKPMIAFARPRTGTAMVIGEPARLARVVENLLDNALSFSPPNGVVRLSATAAGETIIIRVEDDGPGVPEAQRELIFRRFHTERPVGEAFGRHSGLGLAIARTIVEAHDGQILVHERSDAEQGACFEVQLPAAPKG